MKYDTILDNQIITIVGKNKTICFNELHRMTSHIYKKISRSAFTFHIKKLIDEQLLRKDDDGKRGRPVYYFLTEKAKQEVRLKIRGEISKIENNDDYKRRRKLYLLLLASESVVREDTYGCIKTEEELEEFLAKIHASKQHLAIHDESGIYRAQGKIITRYKPIHGVRIYKHEKKTKSGEKQLVQYAYMLPGIAISDLLDKDKVIFEHLDFTREEIEEAFELLKDNDAIIQPILEYSGKLRYIIADPALRDFITQCLLVLNTVMEKMSVIWRYIRKPSKDEIKWLESLTRRKSADEIRIKMYNFRHSLSRSHRRYHLKEAKEKVKSIEATIAKEIHGVNDDYSETIKKYLFTTDELLKMIYPKAIEKSLI